MVVHVCISGNWGVEIGESEAQNQELERSVVRPLDVLPEPGRFNPKHAHDGSLLSVTPVPGHPTPSSGYNDHQACGAQVCIQAKHPHT